MTTTSTPKIEIRLAAGHSGTRRRYWFCGAETDKDAVIAAVYQDGEWTGFVACPGTEAEPGCLGQSLEALAVRLRNQARALRDEAAELEAHAANDPLIPVIPTRQDWQAAYAAYELEVYGETGVDEMEF